MRLFIAATAAAAVFPSAHAADFNAIGTLTQAEFRAFSEDISAALSYKGLIPSEGLGITGFDIGLSATGTELANRSVLTKAAGGSSVPKVLPVGALRAVKGLPFDIDIGVVQMSVGDSNLRATGGELRWAFVGGGTVVPAVALRVSGSSVSGAPNFKMQTLGGDISISKGFAFLTPYAGVGTVETKSRAPGTALREESYRQDKVFAGVNIAFLPLALNLEADRTGDVTSYGVKLAVRW
jgi:hypothetical protein